VIEYKGNNLELAEGAGIGNAVRSATVPKPEFNSCRGQASST